VETLTLKTIMTGSNFCCTTWEVEGIRQRGQLKKTWCDCVKDDIVSLGLSKKNAAV